MDLQCRLSSAIKANAFAGVAVSRPSFLRGWNKIYGDSTETFNYCFVIAASVCRDIKTKIRSSSRLLTEVFCLIDSRLKNTKTL